MPTYAYTCHGAQENVIADRKKCPVCGEETYDFAASIRPNYEQKSQRKDSIEGYRNYFDTGMGCWIRDVHHKREEMKKRGYIPAGSFDSWESYPDKPHQVQWKHPTRGELVRRDGVYVGKDE
jgi:hypothetical protein